MSQTIKLIIFLCLLNCFRGDAITESSSLTESEESDKLLTSTVHANIDLTNELISTTQSSSSEIYTTGSDVNRNNTRSIGEHFNDFWNKYQVYVYIGAGVIVFILLCSFCWICCRKQEKTPKKSISRQSLKVHPATDDKAIDNPLSRERNAQLQQQRIGYALRTEFENRRNEETGFSQPINVASIVHTHQPSPAPTIVIINERNDRDDRRSRTQSSFENPDSKNQFPSAPPPPYE